MVSLKNVAIALICATVGFIAVSAYFGTLPIIAAKLQQGLSAAKTFFSPLINAWNSLPGTAKTVLVAGIPTLISIFMMWTKNRAMQKLNETEAQAATETKQLTGELSTAEHSARVALQENAELKDELAVYKAEGGGLEKALDLNRELQAKLDLEVKKTEQLQYSLTTLRADYEKLLAKVTFEDPLRK